jgi:hypothetical protein
LQEVRNADDKLVCRINPQALAVEIVVKRLKTIIVFMPAGDAIVTNYKA